MRVPDAGVLAASRGIGPPCRRTAGSACGTASAGTLPGTVAVLAAAGQPREIIEGPRRDPVPGAVRAGPRVHLPHRDYFLYTGPAEFVAALASVDATGGQCPNLWWPGDRAWCVASEIDLP